MTSRDVYWSSTSPGCMGSTWGGHRRQPKRNPLRHLHLRPPRSHRADPLRALHPSLYGCVVNDLTRLHVVQICWTKKPPRREKRTNPMRNIYGKFARLPRRGGFGRTRRSSRWGWRRVLKNTRPGEQDDKAIGVGSGLVHSTGRLLTGSTCRC